MGQLKILKEILVTAKRNACDKNKNKPNPLDATEVRLFLFHDRRYSFKILREACPRSTIQYFFGPTKIFARSKSEICFKSAESPTETLATQAREIATCVCSSVFLFNLELLRTSFERNNFTVGSIEQLYFVAAIKLWVCPSLILIWPFTSKLLTATISGVFKP